MPPLRELNVKAKPPEVEVPPKAEDDLWEPFTLPIRVDGVYQTYSKLVVEMEAQFLLGERKFWRGRYHWGDDALHVGVWSDTTGYYVSSSESVMKIKPAAFNTDGIFGGLRLFKQKKTQDPVAVLYDYYMSGGELEYRHRTLHGDWVSYPKHYRGKWITFKTHYKIIDFRRKAQ